MRIGKFQLWGKPAGDTQPPVDTPGVTSVLMVCRGNMCRSPMAEGVLRAKLKRAGLHVRVAVDSAGTHGFKLSEPPDPRAIEYARRRGYDISGLRARPISRGDYQRFDWILAMDNSNLTWLKQNYPEAGGRARVERLLDQALGLGEREVPDPYYGSLEGFDRVLDLVEPACDAFVRRLMSGPLGGSAGGRP